MPSLAEEEDQIVEFGETKLHQLAAIEGSNLTILLKENYSVAARNSQFKTARDIATEKNCNENVRQIGMLRNTVKKFKNELIFKHRFFFLLKMSLYGNWLPKKTINN